MAGIVKRNNGLSSRWSDQEVERGLAAIAYFSGHTRRASAALAQQGLKIPRSTLKNWVDGSNAKTLARYEEVRRAWLPQVHALAAEAHTNLVHQNMEVEQKAIAKLNTALDNDEVAVRELPNVQRNAAVGTGIHSQNAVLLRGMEAGDVPTGRAFTDIVRALQAKNIDLSKLNKLKLTQSVEVEAPPDATGAPESAIDGEAKEITPDG